VPLKVNEIFYSIQGESSHAGRPCAFIRLPAATSAAPTATRSTHTKKDSGWTFPTSSGNSPLLLRARGGHGANRFSRLKRPNSSGDCLMGVHGPDGTNGSMDIGGVDERCSRIVDMKCPSSGYAIIIVWRILISSPLTTRSSSSSGDRGILTTRRLSSLPGSPAIGT